MTIEEILKASAASLLEQYKDFEALKRLYLKSESGSNGWGQIMTGEAPIAETKGAARPIEEADQMGYNDVADQWSDYMSMCANGEFLSEHSEAFPASLSYDEEAINPDDPSFASGVSLGLPKSVWVHTKYAGTILPDIADLMGE